MVLHGIGGCSVEEAKERLSHVEALKWQARRERDGTLHTGMRLEAGFAMLACIVDRKLGGKSSPKDFMPHFRRDEKEATPEELMSLLSGAAERTRMVEERKGKKRG